MSTEVQSSHKEAAETSVAPELTEPSEDKPSEDKPSEDKPSEDKPSEDKPSEDKPSEDKPSEDKPSEDKPSEDKPSEDKPSEDKPSEDKPSEDKPSEDKPSEDKPSEDKPSEDKPPEDKSGFKGVESSEPELTAFVLNKISEVFVPWPGLEEHWSIDPYERLIVIAGQPGSGRFSTAVWVGLKLLNDERPRIVSLTGTLQTGTQLRDWTRSPDRQSKTVYILQQPLGARFAFSTLDDSTLDDVRQKLRDELQSWLILTARPEDLRGFGEQVQLLHMVQHGKEQLCQALDHHLNWIDGNISDLKLGGDLLDDIKVLIRDGTLTTPPQVVRLVAQLPELHRRGGLDHKDERRRRVKKLAEEVAGGMTQDWFARLAAHEILLALLVEAFRGIHQAEVEEIYIREADRLRESDPRFPDPRRHSFIDLYRKIAVETSERLVQDGKGKKNDRFREDDRVEIRLLEFSHESYRAEVLRQIQSRHHLLWEVVKGIDQDLDNYLLPWQAPQRQSLGEVIARIGVHRHQDLNVLMEELVKSPSGITASVPGYILRGICLLDQPDYPLVCRILRGWVQRGDFDYVWGATAAIWRVYSELGRQRTTLTASASPQAADHHQVQRLDQALRQLEDCLTEVAGSGIVDADENDWTHEGDFLSYAVERMFLELPAPVAVLVQKWLKAGGKLKRAGCRAGLRLYAMNKDADSLVSARFEALLDLVGAMLRLKRDMVDEVLQILLAWLGQTEDPAPDGTGDALGNEGGSTSQPKDQKRKIQITRALFTACNQAEEKGRQNLRRALSTLWLRSHSPHARDIAHAIINRARLLDGVAVEMAGASCAVLMVDASKAGRDNDTADRVTQQIFEFLSPQVDLWVVQPGSSRPLSLPGQKLEAKELSVHDEPLARIVMPWIEKLQGPEGGSVPLHFACIIHWAELVDGADLDEVTEVPIIAIPVSGHHLPTLETETRGGTSLLAELLKQVGRMNEKFNEESSEQFLAIVGAILGASLSKILVARSLEHWWAVLQACQPAAADEASDASGRRGRVLTQLEALAGELDQVPASLHGTDPLKLALGLVQWLAVDDPASTVQQLCAWMRTKERNPVATFAAAAAAMLLRMHSSRMLSVATLLHLSPAVTLPGAVAGCEPAPPVPLFLPLLDLAPALAKYGSTQGVQVLLEALRFWAGDPGWAVELPGHSALPAMIDEASPRLRKAIHDTFGELASGHIEALGEKQVPAAVLAVHLRLKCALLQRSTREVDLAGAVLILWHDSGRRGSAGRLGKLAWHLFSRAESERRHRRSLALGHFIFIRAGTRHPVAVSGEDGNIQDTAFTAARPTAGVFFPLLSTLGPAVSQIVLMADGPIVDAEDWLDPDGELSAFTTANRLKLFWDARIDQAPRVTGGSGGQLEWFDLSAADDQTALSLVVKKTAAHLSTLDS